MFFSPQKHAATVVEETPQTVSFDFLLCWMKQKRKEEEEDGVEVARGRECTRYI